MMTVAIGVVVVGVWGLGEVGVIDGENVFLMRIGQSCRDGHAAWIFP